MPQKGLSMRKIREVLRLRYDLGLLQHEIARSCSISQPSVNRYLQRASACGLSWPVPEDCDDRRLNQLLFPAVPEGGSPAERKPPVDFAEVHRTTADHEIIGIVHDVRFQTLLVPQLLPAEHEPAHVQIAQQRADRRALRTPSTFIPITRTSVLVPALVRFFNRSFQPHLDQMEHGSVDDSASYRL